MKVLKLSDKVVLYVNDLQVATEHAKDLDFLDILRDRERWGMSRTRAWGFSAR